MIQDPRNRGLDRGGNQRAGAKSVACASLPSKSGNLSHQNRVSQTEAARLLPAWRAREGIATAIDEIGREKATYGNVQKRSGKYIDRELFTNVLDSGGHPGLPAVEHTRFPYDQSNNNSCGGRLTDMTGGIIRYERVAVYDRFVDVEIYAPHIMRLHPNLMKVSRPTLRWNGDCMTWDVVVFDPKPRTEPVDKVGHVVGLDLNADRHGGISGARYLGHKNVQPTPPKGRPTPKRPPANHRDERVHQPADRKTSGTGKGPDSLWVKAVHLEWHNPSTATIENTRNRKPSQTSETGQQRGYGRNRNHPIVDTPSSTASANCSPAPWSLAVGSGRSSDAVSAVATPRIAAASALPASEATVPAAS